MLAGGEIYLPSFLLIFVHLYCLLAQYSLEGHCRGIESIKQEGFGKLLSKPHLVSRAIIVYLFLSLLIAVASGSQPLIGSFS